MTPTPDLPSGLRRALRRARDGVTLDRTEAEILLSARGEALTELCAAAARVRDQGLADAGRPGVVTYSRKVFLPLTRLCRDRCHYCTFATTPNRLEAPFLSPDEVLAIAERGAALGCKEALFTLGDRPEERWPAAREWLDAHGYDSTLAYVRAMAILVLERTGLLPHLNPGVMSWAELQRLKPVAPSMGMMLETTSREVFEHGAHCGSPDKDPAVRLRVLEDAGRSTIPFTTGLLIGIGETPADRVETLFEIRRIARAYGSIQETIVQNFRAKPDTAMARMPDAEIARAGRHRRRRPAGARPAHAHPGAAEPDRRRVPPAARGRHRRLGRRLAADAGPRQPRAAVAADRRAGTALRRGRVPAGRAPHRLPAVRDRRASRGSTRGCCRTSRRWPARTGWPARTPSSSGRPWQEPEDEWAAGGSSGRTDLHTAIDTDGPHLRPAGGLRQRLRRLGHGGRGRPAAGHLGRERRWRAPARLDADVAAALRSAERDPAGLSDAEALALLHADGAELDAVAALADALRADVAGGEVTYVVNRNINFTNVCYTGCRFCAFAQRRTDADAYTLSVDELAGRAREAWELGATEVCMQGGIHPDMPGTAYFDIVRAVKAAVPDMHVHAFSPMEIVNGAARTGLSVREWLQEARAAGLDTIPGTAAEILDDDVRWLLTKGKLPASEWIEVVTTAHELGIRSSSTMMYGHVDEPSHWLGHLRTLARIQDQTGGFTEFVALPFIHTNAPIYLAGVARPGPTARENRAVHAMARILLHGRIGNIQCSWVKLGVDGCRDVLTGGVNDLGGTLMEETISRMAGSQHGSAKTVAQLHEIVDPLPGRVARQRRTDYGPVPPERVTAAERWTGTLPSLAG